MQRTFAIISALPFCFLPVAALAQGPTVNFGVDITSNYVDEGATVSNNLPAIQPHVELSSGNFYGGLWFSNISSGPDTMESDVYLGLTGAIPGSEKLSYELKYTRVYFNASGDQGGTLEGALTYAPSDSMSLGLTIKNDLAGGPFGLELGMDHDLNNGFGVSAEIGRTMSAGSATFWGISLSKDIGANTSLELGYQDTETTTPLITLTLSWSTDILTQRIE